MCSCSEQCGLEKPLASAAKTQLARGRLELEPTAPNWLGLSRYQAALSRLVVSMTSQGEPMTSVGDVSKNEPGVDLVASGSGLGHSVGLRT